MSDHTLEQLSAFEDLVDTFSYSTPPRTQRRYLAPDDETPGGGRATAIERYTPSINAFVTNHAAWINLGLNSDNLEKIKVAWEQPLIWMTNAKMQTGGPESHPKVLDRQISMGVFCAKRIFGYIEDDVDLDKIRSIIRFVEIVYLPALERRITRFEEDKSEEWVEADGVARMLGAFKRKLEKDVERKEWLTEEWRRHAFS